MCTGYQNAVERPADSVFFLMMRPPPRSALFPYTALCRSRVREGDGPRRPEAAQADIPADVAEECANSSEVEDERSVERRSEEHTSELQSRQYLVCRLLLEKKTQGILRHSALPGLEVGQPC